MGPKIPSLTAVPFKSHWENIICINTKTVKIKNNYLKITSVFDQIQKWAEQGVETKTSLLSKIHNIYTFVKYCLYNYFILFFKTEAFPGR